MLQRRIWFSYKLLWGGFKSLAKDSASSIYPEQIVEAVDKYCTTFYSSNLWDLHSKEVETVYSTWRTNLKLAWDCPRATRGYLVQEVLSCGQDKISTKITDEVKK